MTAYSARMADNIRDDRQAEMEMESPQDDVHSHMDDGNPMKSSKSVLFDSRSTAHAHCKKVKSGTCY